MRFGKINDIISVRNTFHQIFSDFNTFLAVFGGIFACKMLKKVGFQRYFDCRRVGKGPNLSFCKRKRRFHGIMTARGKL